MGDAAVRSIAFYLPQFHPIPENNEFWGPGFTEWTNVARARPLFRGHRQPRLPADLGFYDLRCPETRAAQAQLAASAGVEGFCYWHYWFAGNRVLNRPFDEVVQSGEPRFPFCVAWANETWTGVWHGAPGRTLIAQTYPGEADTTRHFYALLPALCDERYITVDGRSLFVIYRPGNIPDIRAFTDTFQRLAVKEGLKGFFFVGIGTRSWRFTDGSDGIEGEASDMPRPHHYLARRTIAERVLRRLLLDSLRRKRGILRPRPRILDYGSCMLDPENFTAIERHQFPVAVPNWDNTPRSGHLGVVFHGSSPELWERHLRQTVGLVTNRPFDERVLFIKSWNEWAEGNYIEPDIEYGRGWLEATRRGLTP